MLLYTNTTVCQLDIVITRNQEQFLKKMLPTTCIVMPLHTDVLIGSKGLYMILYYYYFGYSGSVYKIIIIINVYYDRNVQILRLFTLNLFFFPIGR